MKITLAATRSMMEDAGSIDDVRFICFGDDAYDMYCMVFEEPDANA